MLSMRFRSPRSVGLVCLVASFVAVSPTTPARSTRVVGVGDPGGLHGRMLREPSHLRLLVADNPPFVLDVDSGRRSEIMGLPPLPDDALVAVASAGRDAVLWIDSPSSGHSVPAADVYVVRRGTTSARFVVSAWEVASTTDGRALWILRYVDTSHCVLREVGLDGQILSGDRPISCSTRLLGGRFGVVPGKPTDALLDLTIGRDVLHAGGIFAAADPSVLGSHPPHRLSIINARTGIRRRLRWPSAIGGLDASATSPNRRVVAVGFGDPAYGIGSQLLDVWLLDLKTHRMRQLPSMPAVVLLKFTSMTWADNERLVFLAQTKRRTLLAIWRRGAKTLALKALRLRQRHGGSDTFVAW
jgi:hypothetical protein